MVQNLIPAGRGSFRRVPLDWDPFRRVPVPPGPREEGAGTRGRGGKEESGEERSREGKREGGARGGWAHSEYSKLTNIINTPSPLFRSFATEGGWKVCVFFIHFLSK